MKNFVQPGVNITVPAPANVASGEYVAIGALGGVAAGAVESGDDLDLVTEGVFDIAADAQDTFIVGARVYYNTSAKVAESAENSNSAATIAIGVCVEAKGAGQTKVRTRLTQPVTTI